MRIPVGDFNQVSVFPREETAPYIAIAEAGEKFQRNARQLESVVIREQQAEDALKALEMGQTIDKESLSIADRYKYRTDHENFDKDIESDTELLKLKVNKELKNARPELVEAVNRHLNQQTIHLSNAIKVKKYEVMEQKGRIAIGELFDASIADYVNESDPNKKEIIKNNFEIQVIKAKNNNLVDPVWADNHIKLFESKGQQTELLNAVNSNDPRVIQAAIDKKYTKIDPLVESQLKIHGKNRIEQLNRQIELDREKSVITNAINTVRDEVVGAGVNVGPNDNEFSIQEQQYESMFRLLRSSDIQKRLGLTSQQANTAGNILEGELKNIRDAKDVKRKGVLRQVGDLLVAHKYTEARSLLTSPYLEGADQKEWSNAIDSDIKAGVTPDPTAEAFAIIKLNRMVSQNKNPDEIRDYIAKTPEIKDKRMQLDELDRKINEEVKEGLRRGYEDIEHIIFPPSRGLTLENSIQSPGQTQAIMKAQAALKGWVDTQLESGKSPSLNDVRKRAWALAGDSQMSFPEKIEATQEAAKKLGEQMRQRGEKKLQEEKEKTREVNEPWVATGKINFMQINPKTPWPKGWDEKWVIGGIKAKKEHGWTKNELEDFYKAANVNTDFPSFRKAIDE